MMLLLVAAVLIIRESNMTCRTLWGGNELRNKSGRFHVLLVSCTHR
jgi:hypothetical protein